ncbi:hypothetical protein [Chryseobacterium sp. T16E-39]|uniref:hypothetical protein n=1 Tax=Chryseobacterium sp. T16E-39 TaxID=2015076 RepID=UPI0012FB830C|nr:hypothetical protein [Chryseobacterium sp. T16E-39]
MGKVGIGNTTPDASLSISRSIRAVIGETPQPAFKISDYSSGLLVIPGNIFEIWRTYQTTQFPPASETKLAMAMDNNGNVRIGATAANGNYGGYKLSVDGDIIAKRCVIQIDKWADYVFANDYHLPDLNEVSSFITKNKHLPGVPSEAEIKEKGLDVEEMNKILMQKVEELTLYIIKLQKEVDQLKTKN